MVAAEIKVQGKSTERLLELRVIVQPCFPSEDLRCWQTVPWGQQEMALALLTSMKLHVIMSRSGGV